MSLEILGLNRPFSSRFIRSAVYLSQLSKPRNFFERKKDDCPFPSVGWPPYRSPFIKFLSRRRHPPRSLYLFRLFFVYFSYILFFQVQCHGNVVIGLFAWLRQREAHPAVNCSRSSSHRRMRNKIQQFLCFKCSLVLKRFYNLLHQPRKVRLL